MARRIRVVGRNGAWDFAFKTKVKHGSGEREVEVGVPVHQLLEIADQFRRCAASTPGHAIYHLQAGDRPRVCGAEGRGRGGYYTCRACGLAARSVEVNPDLRCPTCGQQDLIMVPEEEHEALFARSAMTAGELAVELAKAQEKIRAQEREIERLAGWLHLIDGGDNPCTDQDQLRQWAYEATVLGKEVPA